MRKSILTLTLLIYIFLLNAYIPTVCPLIRINPSAFDAAFGLESGTAGLHYLSPSTFSNNPAKLGAFSGILYENSSSDYNYGKFSYTALSAGYSGIGISMSLPNRNSKTGASLNYADIEYDFNNNDHTVKYMPYEQKTEFLIGIDIRRNLRRVLRANNEDNDCIDLYAGVGLNNITLNYVPVTYFKAVNSSYLNYSFLCKINAIDNEQKNDLLYFTLGSVFINNSKSTVSLTNNNTPDQLPYGNKFGASIYYSRKAVKYKEIPTIHHHFDNYVSVYGSLDNAYYCYGDKVTGRGIEFKFIDLVAFRIGVSNKNKNSGNSILVTRSFGFSPNFSKHYHLNIDYTKKTNKSDIYFPNKFNISMGIVF